MAVRGARRSGREGNQLVSSREKCGVCRGPLEEPFLDLGKTPLANAFPAAADEEEQFHPLGLTRCPYCGLVQQAELVPDEAIYGDDYGYYSGASAAQLAYHDEVAALLHRRHLRGGRCFVIEVGCNDGSLLTRLGAAGHRMLGVDPSAPGRQAAQQGIPVLCEPFTSDLARAIRTAYGPAHLVVANNVLAHIADINDVLAGIRLLLAPGGRAVVEVQYVHDLLAGNMIEQVYHEHRYHWSLTTFCRAAEAQQLHVVDAELIEAQLGSLRVTLAPSSEAQVSTAVAGIIAAERRCEAPEVYESMQCRVDRVRDHLIQIVDRERAAGRLVCGYAAAAKATTVLNYTGIVLPFVVDSTPHKQGRFVPGVKTPIVPPATIAADSGCGSYNPAAVTALLLAPNYLGWLLRHNREFLDAGGRWLVPTPTPTLI
jgi:SAM-dependent methyltransferase